MKVWTLLFWVSLCAQAAVSDPFLVSGKVQTDLENALSRLIPPEQFLVQANADVSMRTERRLVEGETLVQAPEPRPKSVDPMPGFVLESDDKPAPVPPPSRQIFRMVEIPELKSVRVIVNFDETLPQLIQTRGRTLVRSYLQANYPRQASLQFGSMPMLKAEKEKPPEPPREPQALPEKKEEPKPPSESEILWSYARWAMVGLCCLIFLLLLSRGSTPTVQKVARNSPSPQWTVPPSPYESGRARLKQILGGGESDDEEPEEEGIDVEVLRKQVLERFLARSQVFRDYFTQLGGESRAELYSCLQGRAFDKLLEGLAISRPKGDGYEPANIDEILEGHSKDFDEFVRAKDWQDRQFFGFLHGLSNEQLATLVAHQQPAAACLILRMMRPTQSAAVLDMMTPTKRHEILAGTANLQDIGFSELVAIEKQARLAVQQMPDRFFGSPKEDVDFWGNVVSEALDQDSILSELEVTRPDIAPQLTKFRFRLDEAASLPDNLLQRVLSKVDNEELCLALSTCAPDVQEVFLEALSPMRRQALLNLFPSYRGTPKERAMPARQKLTKRIREAMA